MSMKLVQVIHFKMPTVVQVINFNMPTIVQVINFKMLIIVGILKFMNSTNDVFSAVLSRKKF